MEEKEKTTVYLNAIYQNTKTSVIPRIIVQKKSFELKSEIRQE